MNNILLLTFSQLPDANGRTRGVPPAWCADMSDTDGHNWREPIDSVPTVDLESYRTHLIEQLSVCNQQLTSR